MSPVKVGSMSPVRGLRTSVALLCLGFALLSVQQPVQTQAQTPPDALQFFKNYFVTGSHVVGGVGLQGRGVNGVATGSIPMSGVPEGADIVAAFLYWQAVTKDGDGSAGATGVKFGPWAASAPAAPGAGILLSSEDGVLGKVLGTGTPPCWSGGGGTGSSGGSQKTYTYRTDILRFLHIDGTGKYKVNGAYQVQLPDNNEVKALGASLVVIYRDTDTTKPLKAIVLYDGAYTMDQRTEGMFQSIKGFYDGGGSARLTHIVGSGQANKSEIVRFNGTAVATNPFDSSEGPGWDNSTFVIDGVELVGLPTEVTTSVDHEGFSTFDCLTFAATIYETPVKDTDGDGLLDAWESPTPPSDPFGQTLPNLYAMGARANHKDVFVEIGYMKTEVPTTYGGGAPKDPHSHMPTPAAIKLMGDAFANAPVANPDGFKGIRLHVDAGTSYDPAGAADPYIIRGEGLARGGDFLDESITTTGCTREPGVDSVWSCQFSEYPGTVGWKTGFRYIRDEVIGTTDNSTIPPPPVNPEDDDPCDAAGSKCVKRFDANRSDMFHYAFFAHAVGMPKSLNACLDVSNPAAPVEAPDTNGLCPAPLVENPEFFTPRTNSGIADFPGRDILVTLGAFSDRYGLPGGSDFMVASTFFHELGHNIELRHGAAQATAGGPVVPAPNCIPTYLSSMNYLYQLRGLLDDNGKPHLDFSSAVGSAPGNRVDEAGGADVALSFTTPYRIGWYAPLVGSYFAYPDPMDPTKILSRTTVAGRHCDGSLMSSTDPFMVRVDARTAGGAIDWNANGILDGYVFQDLNFNGRTTPAGATAELPQAFNDWANIRLNQVGAGRNVGGPFIDANGDRSFGPLSANMARADWARADWARADWARADWARADWARADWARADWGDLSQGDTVRYGLARADWARADWARADWARADWARADWGRGDDGRGDLGGGDLFVGNPSVAGGELDFETATDLARTPPNEFTACAIGVGACAAPPAASGVLVGWKAPNIGGVTGYSIFRVPGATLLPGQAWVPVPGVIVGPDAQGNYSLVDVSAGYGAQYTYFAVAAYADGIRSDPSNLVTLTTRKASSTVTLLCPAPAGGFTYNGAAQTPCSATYATADGLSGTLTVSYSANTSAGQASASATYPGDDIREGNSASMSFTINKATPVFSGLSGPVIKLGATPTVLGGTLKAGALVPTGSVSITLNGVTQAAGITAAGTFSSSFATGALTVATSPYTITYSYPGDANFTSAGPDTSQKVTVLWYGFQNVQNLPPPARKTFSVGSAVPLRWQFTVSGTVYNSVSAQPEITIYNFDGTGPVYRGTPTDPGASSFQPPTASNGYTWQLNWQTKGLTAGKYRVFVGSVQTGQVYGAGAFGPFVVELK